MQAWEKQKCCNQGPTTFGPTKDTLITPITRSRLNSLLSDKVPFERVKRSAAKTVKPVHRSPSNCYHLPGSQSTLSPEWKTCADRSSQAETGSNHEQYVIYLSCRGSLRSTSHHGERLAWWFMFQLAIPILTQQGRFCPPLTRSDLGI